MLMTAVPHRLSDQNEPVTRMQGVRLADDTNGSVLQHLLRLDAEDRRLRFGLALADEGIGQYVQRIDFSKDSVLAVLTADRRAAGVAHLARGHGYAELGISVLANNRSHGVGSHLLRLAVRQCEAWHIDELFLHYLAENAAMAAFAHRHGMVSIRHGSDVDAVLTIAANQRARQSRDTEHLLRPEALAVVTPA
jgi:GNAT superfamily N-acetyltransferase